MQDTHEFGPRLSPFRPRLINAQTAWDSGVLKMDGRSIVYSVQDQETRELLRRNKVKVSPYQIRSMVPLTMDGLEEALVNTQGGSGIFDLFKKEYEHAYRPKLNKKKRAPGYGVWVFYPETCELTQYPPQIWYELALLASNGNIFMDPERILSWQQRREIFKNYRVGIAGASVGSEIAVTVLKNMRPSQIDIGDPNVFKTIGLNRARRTVRDICYPDAWWGRDKPGKKNDPITVRGDKNKSTAFSGYMNWENPFVDIYTYTDGIVDENRNVFVKRQNVVVEAVDVGKSKLDINKSCRENKVPYFLFSDCGPCVLWLIRRYDLNPDAPLTCFSTDAELRDRMKNAGSSINGFSEFVSALIGPGWKDSGEFAATLQNKMDTVVKSLPQPSSTVSIAAGVAGELISRIALGHKNIPEAGMIDLRTFQMSTYGERI